MTEKRELDEYLEVLWKMREVKQDSVSALRENMKAEFNVSHLTELTAQGWIEFKEDGKKIELTEKGAVEAGLIVRSHRLAERLIHNVMGMHYESGACEFEHIITSELVDSICTLLGHPRECPHGLPIPEGECCKRAASTTTSLVVPLTQLQVGEEEQIAYINCASDQRLNMLEGLQIRPGTTLRLEQNYPVFVVSCEGTNIALDEKIVRDICLWRSASQEPSLARASGKACKTRKETL
ncbi:MAG: metal-dependent transcriptional regulator [Deltaproteobacteria bacterium]